MQGYTELTGYSINKLINNYDINKLDTSDIKQKHEYIGIKSGAFLDTQNLPTYDTYVNNIELYYNKYLEPLYNQFPELQAITEFDTDYIDCSKCILEEFKDDTGLDMVLISTIVQLVTDRDALYLLLDDYANILSHYKKDFNIDNIDIANFSFNNGLRDYNITDIVKLKETYYKNVTLEHMKELLNTINIFYTYDDENFYISKY